MNKYIAVIDSGIGGLDILNQLLVNFKNESFLYVGDNLNVPYGIKTKEELEKIGHRIISYLEKNNVKMILIGCNTLSVNTIDYLRQITTIPIYGIVRPTAKNLLNHQEIKRVLILATQATINTNKYYDFIKDIDENIKVYQQPAPKLVELIESNQLDAVDDVLKEYIEPFYGKIDGIILGCTHFPIVKENIVKLYPDLSIFDSRNQMVQLLNEKLDFHEVRANHEAQQEVIIVATKSIDDLKKGSQHFFDYQNKILKEELM